MGMIVVMVMVMVVPARIARIRIHKGIDPVSAGSSAST